MRQRTIAVLASLALLGVLVATGAGTNALGGSAPKKQSKEPAAGVPGTAAQAQAKSINLGRIEPFRVFDASRYATGGTGLRNQRRGGIVLNGDGLGILPVRAAYVYWAFITQGRPTARQAAIRVQRRWPGVSPNVTIQGTVIGSGPDPCWDGNTITVYRGSIPRAVATGNGFYQVSLLEGSASSFRGQNPWGRIPPPPPPYAEGASIVLISKGKGTTSLYDVGLAGHTVKTVNAVLSYTLILPAAPRHQTLWDNIGADGQHGGGRAASATTSRERTTINGVHVAGPGSPYNDSDWNGSDSLPLPQLWDTTGHDIGDAAPPGTSALRVRFYIPDDCVTTVANVVRTR